MTPGNITFIYTVDGSTHILKYLKEERGFLVFIDEDQTLIPMRPSSITKVTDTGKASIGKLPQAKKEIKPDPYIPNQAFLQWSRGRLHL